jgi:hypothetical protein
VAKWKGGEVHLEKGKDKGRNLVGALSGGLSMWASESFRMLALFFYNVWVISPP